MLNSNKKRQKQKVKLFTVNSVIAYILMFFYVHLFIQWGILCIKKCPEVFLMSTPLSDKILFLMELIFIPSVLLFVAFCFLLKGNKKDDSNI